VLVDSEAPGVAHGVDVSQKGQAGPTTAQSARAQARSITDRTFRQRAAAAYAQGAAAHPQPSRDRPRRFRIQAAPLANQTASQSVQHPAIIWIHARMPTTPVAAYLGGREITDTEEVTGSNPVSPTSTKLPLLAETQQSVAFSFGLVPDLCQIAERKDSANQRPQSVLEHRPGPRRTPNHPRSPPDAQNYRPFRRRPERLRPLEG
jgi:hypothetical protein